MNVIRTIGIILAILFLLWFINLTIFQYGSGNISPSDMLATGTEKVATPWWTDATILGPFLLAFVILGYYYNLI